MAKKKMPIEDLEKKEVEELVNDIVSEDKLELYDEYFSAGLDRSGLAYPKNYYDFIVFNAIDDQRYYYGTAGAHALDALKAGGHFIFNANGSAHIMEEVIHILLFVGFSYLSGQSKNGYYVFQKAGIN